MQYKSFTLDPFQEEAIQALLRGESVVVSAATGTGKTLIADYMIEHSIKNGHKVFYTAPIKALSNQKFHDFTESYGAQKVGLLTGDTVINPEAQIVVMTTEIYRNMLHEGSSTLNGLKFVVFDEIHFINDIERGTVWEESVIFSPDHVRFICLSATIPNFKQFAAWIESISNHKVATVSYMQRAVPLEHFVYEHTTDLTTIDKLIASAKELESYPDYYKTLKKKRRQKTQHPVAKHIDLVKELEQKEWLPAIFFVFSRRATMQKAQELSRIRDFTTPEQKAYIVQYMRQHITPEIAQMPSVQDLRQVLPKGIGVHNAGILPPMKHIVEHLFNKGYLSVLYATETFAVGINMPAKTVCFAALEKYDGINFRYLNTKEYFQLAGRAGRRGIDTVGRSIVMVDLNTADLEKIKAVTEKDIDPIISQFKLSYNTVLNLIQNYSDENTIQTILKSNFGYFVKKQSEQQYRIITSYNNYKRLLTKLGYLKDDKLTQKGVFATNIYTQELVISELVTEGFFDQLTHAQINLILASFTYDARRADQFDTKGVNITTLIKQLSKNTVVARKLKKIELKKLQKVVYAWTEGRSFESLLDICNLAEGDLIRMFRQIIDVLRQIRSGLQKTGMNPTLQRKVEECIAKVDRDIVAVDF